MDGSNNFRGTAQLASGTTTITVAAKDASGNHTTQQYEIDTSGSTTSYTYDTNGNLTSDGTKTYFWNALNQLVEVNEGTTPLATFEYDGNGRRTEKVAAGLTHTYIYDVEDIVEERLSGSASDTIRYYHGAGMDEPLARKNSSEVVTYYLADHLGSIVQETNSTGTAGLQREYDPWGKDLQGGLTSGFAFTGREWDAELALGYYRARYYSPEQGRFLSQDPIGLEGGDPDLYAYVGNTPLKGTDPYGLQVVMRIPPAPDWVPDWLQPDPTDVMSIAPGPMTVASTAARPTITACKAALRKVHKIVGKISTRMESAFGSAARGTQKYGYRGPEPPHPTAVPGSPESSWHFNWWDFTEGKWNRGLGPGKKGAIPIE